MGYSLSIDTSVNFFEIYKASVSGETGETWIWTRSSDTCTSSGTSQTADIKLVEPSSEHTGLPLIGVFYDVLYQTFAFVPVAPGGRIAVAGTVRNEFGRPAPGREVLLYGDGQQYRTFTDGQGRYEFFGDFVGPMEVALRGVPKQPVPQVDGTAILDLIQPVQIPRPLRFGPWVHQPPSGIDLVPVQHLCHTPSAFQLLVTIGNRGNTDAPASITRIEFIGPPTPVLLSTPPIAAGQTVELPPINWSPECAVTPSSEHCDFIVTADSENQLNEFNEANNRADVQCSFIR